MCVSVLQKRMAVIRRLDKKTIGESKKKKKMMRRK